MAQASIALTLILTLTLTLTLTLALTLTLTLTWHRRPYLPMTHMEGLSRLATRAHSPAANVPCIDDMTLHSHSH